MKGTIKTYLPEKRYGFIKGDDGKDYFFHANAFLDQRHVEKLSEEMRVLFDQEATPKGYKANACMLVDPSARPAYVVPDEFICSRANNVRGWEIAERGDWIIHGSSRNLDEAKQEVIDRAKKIGANALIELKHKTTTKSETSDSGKGTHYYTQHSFSGRPVVVARRSASGTNQECDLLGLNERADELKEALTRKTAASERRSTVVWSVVGVLSLISLAVEPWYIALLVVIGVVLGIPWDYDSWLEPAPYD